MCLAISALHVVYACIYGVVVFSTTFDNSSVVSWMSVNWWRRLEYPEKSTDQRKWLTDFILIYICIYIYLSYCNRKSK